jgi:hypothetical protein
MEVTDHEKDISNNDGSGGGCPFNSNFLLRGIYSGRRG